jgi:hypothetical protein
VTILGGRRYAPMMLFYRENQLKCLLIHISIFLTN